MFSLFCNRFEFCKNAVHPFSNLKYSGEKYISNILATELIQITGCKGRDIWKEFLIT